MLNALPNKVEAALEADFYLSNHDMNRVVDGLEELGDLVDAEKRIGVENERNSESGQE